jgi:regulatory protein YycH of two-component signal transduction system YycFG
MKENKVQKSISKNMREIKKLLKDRGKESLDISLKIVRDRKNNKVHFIFKTKYLSETEYIVDEFSLRDFFENIITSSWFIEKKEDGKQVYPES